MKKLLIILSTVLLVACSDKQADFTTVKITSQINNGEIEKREYKGKFSKSIPDQLGFIEVTDSEKRLKVSYYQEAEPNVLRFLNVKFGDNKPTEFRVNSGHDLFMLNKKDSLMFIFGDKNCAAGLCKGTILFTK